MDDKTELAAQIAKITAILEAQEKATETHQKNMEAHWRDIAACLDAIRNRSEAELRQRLAQLNAITAAPKFLAGRWTRRDGDSFATLNPRPPQPAAEEPAPDGDSTPGHL